MQIVMKLYIIAGEKSGDIHGALLLKNLLRLMPGMEVAGLGGQGMHALCPGVEDWADEAAVIGVVEVLCCSLTMCLVSPIEIQIELAGQTAS